MPLSHARASLGFCTFCFHNLHRKGLKKRWSFLRKSPTFFYFSPTFSEKCRTFLWASSHVFESWLQFADKQGALKVTFSFFLSKKCLFSALVCEDCESKKTQIPGNAPACHVRARKTTFSRAKYDAHHESLIETNSPRFLPPLLQHFSPPKWVDSFKLSEDGWHSHQDTMISPREFASKLYY